MSGCVTGHVPVLFEACMQALAPERGGLFVDGTLGGGGHAEGMLSRGNVSLIGIDKDAAAIARCKLRLASYAGRVTFVQNDFMQIAEILQTLHVSGIDGALLDLGISSYQLDEAERGFSYQHEAKLDMRMDAGAPLSAWEVVNAYPEAQLRKVIFEYGEEKFGGRIAAAIVRNRPIETTTQLAEVVKQAIPAAARRTGGHPAKRTFQAIRIEVNGELAELPQAVEQFIRALNPGGRLAVITFHSLEDRIVKQAFRTAENPCTCPPDFPQCVCGKMPLGKCLTRKPILPDACELLENPRAHSAKLRVFEKKR